MGERTHFFEKTGKLIRLSCVVGDVQGCAVLIGKTMRVEGYCAGRRLFPAAEAAGPRFYALEALEPRVLLAITEPNDSLAQAYNLGTLSGTQSISDAVGPSDVNDYIKFTTTAAGTVNLTLSGLTSDANLQLLDGAGAPLATSSNSGTAVDHVNKVLAAGTYYARVTSASTATNYTLQFSGSSV